jgi:hypothetical protein
MFLISLALTSIANALTTYGYLGYYLVFNIDSPTELKVGTEATVKFTFSATKDIQIKIIQVSISGAGISYDKTWNDVSLPTGNAIIETVLLRPTKEGGISCYIYAEYSYPNLLHRDWDKGTLTFQMAYARTTTYAELSDMYIKLKADYDKLLTAYNKLKSDYDSLYTNYLAIVQDRDYWKNQSDYWKSQYDKFVNEYNSLNATYNSLLANYTTLQSIYNSTAVEYATLQSIYKSLNSTYYSLKSEYDNLSSKHSALQSTYNSLKSEYDGLKSKYDALTTDLGTTRSLNYIFIITTIVFIATTAFFIMRKSKLKPKIETK